MIEYDIVKREGYGGIWVVSPDGDGIMEVDPIDTTVVTSDESI